MEVGSPLRGLPCCQDVAVIPHVEQWVEHLFPRQSHGKDGRSWGRTSLLSPTMCAKQSTLGLGVMSHQPTGGWMVPKVGLTGEHMAGWCPLPDQLVTGKGHQTSLG
jgi:hypothetical protein